MTPKSSKTCAPYHWRRSGWSSWRKAPARTFDRSDGVRTQRRAAVLLMVGYPSDCRAQVARQMRRLTRGSAVAPLIHRLADAHPWGDIGVFKHPRQDRQHEE